MRPSAFAVLILSSTAILAQDSPSPAPALSGSALIDEGVKARWTELGLKPAGPSGDAEFLRRLTLDIAGVIPSMETTERFLADNATDKRAKMIEELLAGETYAQNWAEIWTGTLLGYDADAKVETARAQMERGLRPKFAENLPFDRFATDIITASGQTNAGDEQAADDPAVNPATVFFARYFRTAQRELPQALAGKFSRTFLGTQIQCAQCHDHPFDAWTQEDFYGMAAFFTEMAVRREYDKDKMDDKKRKEYFVVEDREGGRFRKNFFKLEIPGSKDGPPKPRYLSTKEAPARDAALRGEFARMTTSKENLQFARAAVNRYWGHFFGRGIVQPVDDFNDRNKATHPELLEALTRDFIAHSFDLKWLIRSITMSAAYQLTSAAKERPEEAERYFALAPVRALTPEQIFRSVITVATPADGGSGAPRDERRARGALKAVRFAFGDDEGAETLEFEGTIPGALLMMNNEELARGLSAGMRGKGGATRLAAILKERKEPAERIRAIYLAALCRPPTRAELSRNVAYVDQAGGGPAAYEDVLWALTNSSEFLFNH